MPWLALQFSDDEARAKIWTHFEPDHTWPMTEEDGQFLKDFAPEFRRPDTCCGRQPTPNFRCLFDTEEHRKDYYHWAEQRPRLLLLRRNSGHIVRGYEWDWNWPELERVCRDMEIENVFRIN
jgi:hypothetical protein